VHTINDPATSSIVGYVVIRGCTEQVNVTAFGQWYLKVCGGDADDVARVVKQLVKGRRITLFLSEREAKPLLRHADEWGLTGVTQHAEDDMSGYPAPPEGFLTRWWRRLRG